MMLRKSPGGGPVVSKVIPKTILLSTNRGLRRQFIPRRTGSTLLSRLVRSPLTMIKMQKSEQNPEQTVEKLTITLNTFTFDLAESMPRTPLQNRSDQVLAWNSGESVSKQAVEESQTLEEYLNKQLALDPMQPIGQLTGEILAAQFNQARGEVSKIVSKTRTQFRPTKVIAISVVHRDFSELRRLHQFRNFADLHTLLYDRKKFLQGLKCLFGVGEVELRSHDDLEFAQFSQVFKDLTNDLKKNKAAGEKTLVVFLFGGHGIQDNFTYALCNSLDLAKIWFPLEERLRMLAGDKNIADSTYTFAILDCCREKMSIKDVREKVKGETTAGRGAGQAEDGKGGDSSRSLVAIFPCPPNSFTPVDSTAVVEYFTNIWHLTDVLDMSCNLPGFLLGWKPGNKGEVVCWVKKEAAIKFNIEAEPTILTQSVIDRIIEEVLSRATSSVTETIQKMTRVCFKPDLVADNRCMLALNAVKGKMEWLVPYKPSENPNLERITCPAGQNLFEVQKDGTCLMNVPDFENGKFQQENVPRIPFEELQLKAILVYLPKSDWNIETYIASRLLDAKKYAEAQKKLIAKQKMAEQKKQAIETLNSADSETLARSEEAEQLKQDKLKYDEKQKLLKSAFSKISGYGRVRKENQIMAFGPEYSDFKLLRPWIYGSDKNTWSDLKPGTQTRLPALHQERLGGKGLFLGGFVYAIGGETREGESISTVERLHIDSLGEWELLDCAFKVPQDHDLFEVCPLNDKEIMLVAQKIGDYENVVSTYMAVFDTTRNTIKEISCPSFSSLKLHSMTQLKSNEVLFAYERCMAKLFRFGSDSAWVFSGRNYPEMKQIVAAKKETEFDINKAIRNHDPKLGQLDSVEKTAVYRWQELHWLEYCYGKRIYDYSLTADYSFRDWYPLKVAKELFTKQNFCREEFADLLKQLWNKGNQKCKDSCEGEHPTDLLDAKIDVLVKLHPERPNQFTFEDLELLHRLEAALSKVYISHYFYNIHDEKRRKKDEAKAAAEAARQTKTE